MVVTSVAQGIVCAKSLPRFAPETARPGVETVIASSSLVPNHYASEHPSPRYQCFI